MLGEVDCNSLQLAQFQAVRIHGPLFSEEVAVVDVKIGHFAQIIVSKIVAEHVFQFFGLESLPVHFFGGWLLIGLGFVDSRLLESSHKSRVPEHVVNVSIEVSSCHLVLFRSFCLDVEHYYVHKQLQMGHFSQVSFSLIFRNLLRSCKQSALINCFHKPDIARVAAGVSGDHELATPALGWLLKPS